MALLPGKPSASVEPAAMPATPEIAIPEPVAQASEQQGVQLAAPVAPTSDQLTEGVPQIAPPRDISDVAGEFLRGRQDAELERLLESAQANIASQAPAGIPKVAPPAGGVPDGPWPMPGGPPQTRTALRPERPFTPADPNKPHSWMAEFLDLWTYGPAGVAARHLAPNAMEFFDDVMVPDFRRGIIAAPKQVLGGVRDSVQNTINALDDMFTWIAKNSGALNLESDAREALGFARLPDDARLRPTLPEVGKSDVVTGQLVRGASQFLSGFVAGRR